MTIQELVEFDQDKQLKLKLRFARMHDAENGVCVGCCVEWLHSISKSPYREFENEAPLLKLINSAHDRLSEIRENFKHVIKVHKEYENIRKSNTGQKAKEKIFNRKCGDSSSEMQNNVPQVKMCESFSVIKQQMAADISVIGRGVIWTISGDFGRHAIAGFGSVSRLDSHQLQRVAHIFDPNVGEYLGTWDNIDNMLSQLFKANKLNSNTMQLERCYVSAQLN